MPDRNPRPPRVVEPGDCSLDAAALEPRIARWRTLLDHARGRPDGASFVWSLPAERAGELAELVAAERQCCSFLDLRVDGDAAAAHLRVGADPSRSPRPGTAADRALRLLTGRPSDPGHRSAPPGGRSDGTPPGPR